MYLAQDYADGDGTDEYTCYDPDYVHYLNAHMPTGTAIA